jgi:hypothetical protein
MSHRLVELADHGHLYVVCHTLPDQIEENDHNYSSIKLYEDVALEVKNVLIKHN